MLTNNDKITVPQTVALVIITILGTGVLSLPRNVAEAAGSDGWILVILGGIFAFGMSLLIGALVKKFPQDTFVEYSQKVLGKALGYPLSIILILYFVGISALTARTFADIMNAFMLLTTPRSFIISTILLLSAYLMRHGIEPIARIGEILLPILIVPIFAMYLFAIPRADFSELLPFLVTPAKTMAIGVLETTYSYFGFEILLMMGPYMRSTGRVLWTLLVSLGSVTLIYLFIVVVVFASIGVEDTGILLWPSMSIIRTIMAPGGVLERLDALAMALWTIAAFTTINGLYFAGTLAMNHLTKSKEFRFFVTIMFPWVYFVAIIPRNPLDTMIWMKTAGAAGLVISAVVPAIILIVSALRKQGGKTA